MSIEMVKSVCYDCGVEKLHRAPGFCVWRLGVCDICKKETDVTEPFRFNGIRTVKTLEFVTTKVGDITNTMWGDVAHIGGSH
jgi:hypothetical protein